MRVFVVLWNDGGTPNCNLFMSVGALTEEYRFVEHEEAALKALENPGDPFPMDSLGDVTVRYCEVAEF